MRGRPTVLLLTGSLPADPRPRVQWTWSPRTPIGRLVRPGADSAMALHNGPPRVIALVAAECFSLATGVCVVWVFDDRWAGGTTVRARRRPRWEPSSGLWAAHLYRVRGGVRAGADARGAGSRVLRRRGGRILGTGFGSSLRSSIGFLSLFLGDESLPARGGHRRSRLRWETVALPHLGERRDILIADCGRGRPGEAVGVVASTLLAFLGRECRSGRVRVCAVRIGVLELREVRGEDGGVTPKSTQHRCLASTWLHSRRLHDVSEASSLSGTGRDSPFGPDLMKAVQFSINADFSIASQ